MKRFGRLNFIKRKNIRRLRIASHTLICREFSEETFNFERVETIYFQFNPTLNLGTFPRRHCLSIIALFFIIHFNVENRRIPLEALQKAPKNCCKADC
jgi:hypothetical protein